MKDRSKSAAGERRYWAEIIARKGHLLDLSSNMPHPWHDPALDRLEVLLSELAGKVYEEASLEEMADCLREDERVRFAKPPLGRRWQHFSRLLKHRLVLPEHRIAPPGRLLGDQEFPRLLGACICDGDIRAFRDAAMFALVYTAAATTSELASLDLADWDPAARSVHLGRGYRRRRGFEDRVVELGLETANLLAGWICLRGSKPGRIFYSLDRYGAVKDKRITIATVHAALRQRCNRAALPHIVPEDLRRTGLTGLLRSGADLFAVADIAGDQTTEQTQLYLPPGAAAEGAMLHGETALRSW